MFCGCELEYGAPENTRTCPVCLAHPGALPVPNEQAIEWTIRLGLALGCEIAGRALFHRKNYFYPRPAQGLPDLPVRRPALRRRALRRPGRRRRPRDRDHARAPRGGRGQDRPRRRRRRPDRRCRVLARRLQPRRHAARRDRDRARPALRRRGQALPPAAAPDDRRAGDLGRGDGEGHAPRGRQRLRPRGGRDRLPHAHGDQEHELLQLHRARDRGRDRAPDRASGSRAARSSSRRYDFDAASGTLTAAALEGGGRGLPLLPRARPGARRAAARARRAAAQARCREPPGARVRRLEAALDFETATGLVTSGRDRLYQARRRRGRRRAGDRERGHEPARGRRGRPGRGRRRRAREADRGAREHPARRLRRGDRRERRAGLHGREVPGRGGRDATCPSSTR